MTWKLAPLFVLIFSFIVPLTAVAQLPHHVIHLSGQNAPGVTDGVFKSVHGITGSSGGILVYGDLEIQGSVTADNDTGLWYFEPGGQKSLLMRENDTISGLGILQFSNRSTNGNGQFAFKTWLSGAGVTPDNDFARVGPSNGSGLTLQIREGDAVPDRPGMTFLTVANDRPLINSSGITVNRRVFTNEGAGIFRTSPGGAPETIAHSGETPVGYANHEFDGTFSRLAINDNGTTVFHGNARSLTQAVLSQGIWRKTTSGNLELVAGARTSAPIISGSEWVSLTNPTVNNAEQIAFRGRLQLNSSLGINPSNDDGVFFRESSGQFSFVTRESDAIPNTNLTMGDTTPFSGGGIGMNSSGTVAFTAGLLNSSSSSAIFKKELAGNVEVIAKQGDLAPNAGGAEFMGFATNNVEINARGDLLFSHRLTGSGVTSSNDEA